MEIKTLNDLYKSIKNCREFSKVILTKCPIDVNQYGVAHTSDVWNDGVAVNKMFHRESPQYLRINKDEDIVIAYNEQYEAIYVCREFPHWYFISGLHHSDCYNPYLFNLFYEIVSNH